MNEVVHGKSTSDNGLSTAFFPKEYVKNRAISCGFTLDEILSRCRNPDLVRIRWDIAKELRAHGLSYAQIGRVMNRDHSSIIHAVRS